MKFGRGFNSVATDKRRFFELGQLGQLGHGVFIGFWPSQLF